MVLTINILQQKEDDGMQKKDLEKISLLRRELHANAEGSGKEEKTQAILKRFLLENTSLEIIEKGKWFYAVKRGENGSSRIAFRADMDGVSSPEGYVAHMCGHDGHSAVLAGLGLWLEKCHTDKSIFLLFQHGEETGEGAKECKAMLTEEGIEEIYGFHNIPAQTLGTVLLRKGTFACASKGMTIRLVGKPSHAAYPELGINPAFLIGRLITELPVILDPKHYEKMVLCTIIKATVGDHAFGVSASRGELLLTIRGEREEDLQKLQTALETFVREYAEKEQLEYEICYSEEFPATVNETACVEKVKAVCEKAEIPTKELEVPFRWSEDFGHYLKVTRGAFFGIGDGEEYAGLHTENYEFPDAILERAIETFGAIIEG